MTFLITKRGTAFASPASFGNWFRNRCVEANVPGRAHGLRKAGAVLTAEHGATTDQMMAIFGWTSEDMPTLYTKRANRQKMSLEHGRLLDRNKNAQPRTLPKMRPAPTIKQLISNNKKQ